MTREPINRDSTLIKPPSSITELLGAASGLSVALTAVYYVGFFNKIGISFVSTLSVPDFLVGALVGIAPAAAAMSLGYLVSDVERSTKLRPTFSQEQSVWSQLIWLEKIHPFYFLMHFPEHMIVTNKAPIAILLTLGMTGLAIWQILFVEAAYSAYVVTAMIVGFMWLGMARGAKLGGGITLLIAALAVLLMAFALGRSSYESKVRSNHSYSDAVVLKSGPTFYGNMLLVTSSGYLMRGRTGYTQHFRNDAVNFVKIQTGKERANG